MITGIIPILLSILASLALSWGYFLRAAIKRPPIGVMNLWDVTFMMASILIVPYLYLLLPLWVVTALLALATASVIYFVLEPVVRAKIILWLLTLGLILADIATVISFGTHSRIFHIINNLILVLVIIGVSNVWAQNGMKARDAAVLGVALIVYDWLFTSVLPFMSNLFDQVADFPFAPLVAWPIGSDDQLLAIGLGDLLLATVFPLIMRKAYGQRAGLIALLVAFSALITVLALPVMGHLQGIFPVMVVLGSSMLLQYLYWHRQLGAELTMWQYLRLTKTSYHK